MRQMLQAMAMLLVLGCTNASAFDAAKIAAIEKAAASFAALAGDSAHTGRPPRQTDPAAKPLIDLVLDTTEIQSGPVQPMSALSDLSKWTLAVLKVGLVYTLAGSGVTDIAALTNDPEVIKTINANAAKFAPEMGRYFDAQMWLQGAVMETVAVYLSTASQSELDRPNIKNGVAQIRAGNTQSINGVITSLNSDGLTDAWRRDRVAVLAAIAPKAAKFLLPDDLRTLSAAATAIASQLSDPNAKAALTSVGAALTPH